MRFCSRPLTGSKNTNWLAAAQATITDLSSGVGIRWCGSLHTVALPVTS